MNGRALVSAVIPSYNYARFIRQAVDGALAQTYRPLEVVVVDDGSSDDSRALLAGYGDAIRVFHQERLGASEARNRGIREARGRFIALLDSDDYWHPEKISKQMLQFASARVGLVYTGLGYVDADGASLGQSTDGFEGDVLRDFCLFTPPGVKISGSSALVRRECFDEVGLFDPKIASSSDWDMWRRLASRFDFAIVREPLTFYRLHAGSMRHDVEGYRRAMLMAMEKTFSDPAARRIHGVRRMAYANFYRILSGCYFRNGNFSSAVRCAFKSVATHPAALGYFASTPLRWLQASRTKPVL